MSRWLYRPIGRAAFLLVLIASTGLRAEPQQNAQPPAGPSPRAVEALHLLESPDPYERQLGFLRLEALREPGTVEAISPYLESRDAQMRAYSLRALAAIQGADAVPVLLRALKMDHDPVVRRAALLGLEPLQSGNSAILPAFLKALLDRNTDVRMAAVDIVSRIQDPRAREAMVTRYKRERRKDVRRVLDVAIRRVKSP